MSREENNYITYAQNREDLYIASFFPDVEKGFYIDIGAHHPTLESVTKFFYDRGWSGINIEPQRKQIKLFNQLRKRDINLNIGVSDKETSLDLREYPGGGLSTFSPEMKSKYNKDDKIKTVKYREYKVKVRKLSQVFEEYVGEKKVNFLKIDVEGMEYEVISGNDWQRFRPELICIESNHMIKDWRPLLSDAKYTKVLFDGLNEYYLANESIKRLEKFNYVERFLAGMAVGESMIPFPTAQRIQRLEAEKKELSTRIEDLIHLNIAEKNKFKEIENHYQELIQYSKESLRFHIKYLPYAIKHRAAILRSKKGEK